MKIRILSKSTIIISSDYFRLKYNLRVNYSSFCYPDLLKIIMYFSQYVCLRFVLYILILSPNFHRLTQECHPCDQYDSSLKIILTFNNISGQMGKQNIYRYTLSEYLLYLFIQLSCFYSHLLKMR